MCHDFVWHPVDRMCKQDVPLELTTEQDPRFVVQEFLCRRELVVHEDNQVDVYLSHHLDKYVFYCREMLFYLTLYRASEYRCTCPSWPYRPP